MSPYHHLECARVWTRLNNLTGNLPGGTPVTGDLMGQGS
jgi:hypothetical protein